jgi:hypothetical protein
MHVCATLRSAVTRLRYKNTKKRKNYLKRKKSRSGYISHMRGGALIQPIAIEVCTSVQVTNVINHVNFCGCRLRGLVSHASAVAQGNVVRAISASYGKSLYSTLRRMSIRIRMLRDAWNAPNAIYRIR